MSRSPFPRIATLKTAAAFRAHLEGSGIPLGFDDDLAPAGAALRETLVAAHRERFGANADGDLYVGLQLTHSGRHARPDVHDRPAPIAACANPILDRRFPGGVRIFDDVELDALVDDFVAAAR